MVCDQKEAELRGLTKETLDYMVENGLIYSGETVAELAENMGVPADALETTVSEFNELVKVGQHGRTPLKPARSMHRRFHRQSIIPWAVWRLTATPKCLMPTAMSSPAFMRLVK